MPKTAPLPAEAEGLKGDQLKAFRKVTRLLAEQQRVVKLCGYAGTGKTFLLARLAAWAKGEGYQVTVAAPTHKAAAVIRQKLDDYRVSQSIEVWTIHSLLGLRLEPDMHNDTGGRILQATDSKGRVRQGLVICDEASMVGSTLKQHIDATPTVSWVFVGDLAQLPPVGETISELLDDPDASLEEVLRQAKGSEILNLATRIRGGDLSMEFAEGRDVHAVPDAESLLEEAYARFQSEDYRKDPSHARVLVFRNSRRETINQAMRAALVGSPEPYVEGEWLVMYAAFAPEKSRLNVLAELAKKEVKGTGAYSRAWKRFYDLKKSLGSSVTQLHVSEEVRVVGVAENQVTLGRWTFDVYSLRITTKDGEEFTLPVLLGESRELHRKVMEEQMAAALAKRKERDEQPEGSVEYQQLEAERRTLWGVYFTLEETFAQVDYAYAMTVHKSQGSTFDHVYVDVPDLLCAGPMKQRILYTACTRPAKSLTFYR